MGILDNIGKTLSEVGQTTIKKGADVANAAKYSIIINEEEHRLERLFCELGKSYYVQHENDYEADFSELMNSIIESKEKINELEELMREIKGITKCPACGEDVPSGASYCPNCGNSVKEEKPEDEQTEKKAEKTICPKCSSILKAGTNFCTKCGTPLDGSYVPEADTPIEVVEPEDIINIPKPNFTWDTTNSSADEEKPEE